jgi:Ca2+-binding RTX toxin-like protein
MATIEVCARKGHPYGGAVEKAHSYLVITYDDGSQYYLRAGGEDSGGEGSRFVSAEYGSYVAGTVDWDAEGDDLSIVVFAGSDAQVAAKYATMQQLTANVNAALYPYVAGINDCNCFTGTLLDGIGIPRTVPMNTDGYTIWCPASLNTFTYEPGPRFTALLGSRLQWAEANNISDALGAAVFFAEAFIKDPWPSAPTAEKTASSLAELDLWLEQTTGGPAVTGSNANDSLTGTDAAEVVAALAGADNISALGGNDLIYGGQGIDTISAGAGNDLIDGGVGPDKMSGGAGDDLYMVDNTLDATTELANEGLDTVKSSVTLTLRAEVENLVLTGSSALNGTGNTSANVLTGNAASNTLAGGSANDTLQGVGGNDVLRGDAGDDVLDGGSGSDQMTGAAGNDVYWVDSTGDVVTEAVSSGTDLVNSSLNYLLGSNLENLTLVGTSAISGTGNAVANTLIGNAAANTLNGGSGNDRLAGDGGNDMLTGSTGTDTFVFADNSGSDTVTDFANGSEKFDLQAVAGLTSFSQLVLTDTGPGVLVDYRTGSFLIANASNFSSIDATDFLL